MNPNKFFKDANFMTPNVIYTGWIIEGKKAFEFSTGRGIGGGMIFGVTISSGEGFKRIESDYEESDCFPTETLAKRHISKLQAAYRDLESLKK